jgi:hypothetical protein
MSPVPHRSISLLLIALGASACSGWQVQPVAPAEILQAPKPPSAVRLRLQDDSRLVLESPRLEHVTVWGMRSGARAPVPLGTITELSVRRFSPGKTVGLVAVGVAGFFAVAAVACASGGCAPNFGTANLGE